MTKNQHFVPRFILRNFSLEANKKLINIHLLKNNQFLYSKPLYEQACGHYLYGSDQKLENFFQTLESSASVGIRKLLNKDLSLSKEEKLHIKLFVLYQINRTPSSVETINQALELNIKHLASYKKELKDHLDDFSIELINPYFKLFQVSTEAMFSLMDLRIGLLEVTNSDVFIIGEHPVTKLNPFLCERKWIGSKLGIALKGALIIFPISPTICLVLYDNIVYSFKNFKNIITIDSSDLNKLNKCQYLNTANCIYFNSLIDRSLLSSMNMDTKDNRESIKTKLDVYENINNKHSKTRRELVMMGSKELPIEQKFNFIAIKEVALYQVLNNYGDVQRDFQRLIIQLRGDN